METEKIIGGNINVALASRAASNGFIGKKNTRWGAPMLMPASRKQSLNSFVNTVIYGRDAEFGPLPAGRLRADFRKSGGCCSAM